MFLRCVSFMRSSKKVLYAPTRGACDAGGVRPAECREEKGRQATGGTISDTGVLIFF